jgi:hypothetical protein
MSKESEIEKIAKNAESLESIDKAIDNKKACLAEIFGCHCFPLLLNQSNIGGRLVDDVFDNLKDNYKDCKNIAVIIDSGGGNIDAAYNLATLFRQFATEKLVFIVPRWAKSAATLLVCAGDEILMTPPAELGPLDPQITVMNPLEKRLENFSPLHIASTLDLIREEFEKGHEKLATGLLNRLQFPLTLGSFRKSLDVGKEYMRELLSTRRRLRLA